MLQATDRHPQPDVVVRNLLLATEEFKSQAEAPLDPVGACADCGGDASINDHRDWCGFKAVSDALEQALRATNELLNPIPDALTLRPEVVRFAIMMELRMRANDHKPGWRGAALGECLGRIRAKTDQLEQALLAQKPLTQIQDLTADIGNYAMIVRELLSFEPEST